MSDVLAAFIPHMGDPPPLSELERDLLELCATASETTTTLDEEMLESSPGRRAVEATLTGLLERGLLATYRGLYAGRPRQDDGRRVYVDDWWDVTPAGRSVIGELGQRQPPPPSN